MSSYLKDKILQQFENGFNTAATPLRGLDSVRVSKTFLLEKLQENRGKHEDLYNKAITAWYEKSIALFEDELNKFKRDKNYSYNVYIQKPTNHVADYDKTLDLLNASLDNEFVLDAVSFNSYVRDEWSWSSSFTTTVSGCLA